MSVNGLKEVIFDEEVTLNEPITGFPDLVPAPITLANSDAQLSDEEITERICRQAAKDLKGITCKTGSKNRSALQELCQAVIEAGKRKT